MKHFSIISFSLIFLLSVVSCADKTEEAKSVSEHFLNAYFSNDYHTAAGFCSEDLAETVSSLANEYDALDQGIKDAVNKVSSELEVSITEVIEEKNLATVGYNIVSPESPTPNRGYLKLNRVDKKWVIVSLNR